MTNDEKKTIAQAAREVAKEALKGRHFGTGSPFCADGSPKCAMGCVLFLAGYSGKEGHSTFAIDPNGNEVDAYHLFHEAINDGDNHDKSSLIARIWRNNDMRRIESMAEALNDFATEIEQHI